MHLILSEVWMDHPVGTKLVLTDSFAKTLLERGVAKEVKKEEVQEPIDNAESKDVEAPPIDKMLKLNKRK